MCITLSLLGNGTFFFLSDFSWFDVWEWKLVEDVNYCLIEVY